MGKQTQQGKWNRAHLIADQTVCWRLPFTQSMWLLMLMVDYEVRLQLCAHYNEKLIVSIGNQIDGPLLVFIMFITHVSSIIFRSI